MKTTDRLPMSVAPLDVRVVKDSVEKLQEVEAAHYGVFQTFSLVGTENGLPILGYDRYRRRAVIQVNNPISAGPQSVTGSVTNPGAGAFIANIPGAPFNATPGMLWQINWTVGLEGTVTAADADNMRLIGGLTTLATARYSGVDGEFPQQTVYAVLPTATGGNLSVQSIAAASGVAAIYNASITAIPVGNANGIAFVRIGSLNQVQNNSGGKLQAGNSITIEDIQAYYVTADGSNPLDIIVLNERYDPNGLSTPDADTDIAAEYS